MIRERIPTCRSTLDSRLSDGAGEELDALDGIVIAGNHMGDARGVTVGIAQRHNRNAELHRLANGDVLAPRVDDEEAARRALHVLDAAQGLLHLVDLAGQVEGLLLGEELEPALVPGLLQVEQPLNGLADGLEVGEGAAEPAVVHVVHVGPDSLLGDDVPGCTLGADKENGLAAGRHRGDVPKCSSEAGRRLLQIDDVDPVLLAVDKRPHLGVPKAGLMAKVHTCLKQVAQRDAGHGFSDVPHMAGAGSGLTTIGASNPPDLLAKHHRCPRSSDVK